MKSARAIAPVASPPPGPQVLSELRVSAHLMTLDPGLFTVLLSPVRGANPATGLPGVRIARPPAVDADSVQIIGFAGEGWLSGAGDALLLRIVGRPAQVMVTIYQSPDAPEEGAPNLQVTRLLDGQGAVPIRPEGGRPEGGRPELVRSAPPAPVPLPIGAAAPPVQAPRLMEMVAHIQERGDVGAMLGEWMGERGSKKWIEGFGLAPTQMISSDDIEYQAVLGPGWLSPWVEGGQFCGSRGMALPVLGLRVRLRGEAAKQFELQYSASFVDGTEVGPVGEGEPCEAASLAALESFRVDVRARGRAAAAEQVRASAPTPAKSTPRRATASEVPAAPVLRPAAASASKKKPAPAPVAPARGRLSPPPPSAKARSTKR